MPGPGGRPWIDTTLRGQAERGTGILNNSIYVGELAWNRCSYVKNPSTGKREARVNPTDQWEHRSIPELRIVEQAVWDRVKARQSAASFEMGRDDSGNALNRTHRRRFVLSGLLRCSVCGGGYTIMAKDRYGCAAHTKSGTCINGSTISRASVEERVLGSLRDRMLSPDLVATFIQSYQAELAAERAEHARTAAAGRHDLDDVCRRLASLVDAMERGGWSPSLQSRLTELETRKAKAEAALEERTDTTTPVLLHPATADTYRAKVADLINALADPEIQTEAGDALRALVDHVMMVPDAAQPDRHRLELHGELAMALHLGDATSLDSSDGSRNRKLPKAFALGSRVSVVAGTGFEPVTFRL